MQETEQDLQEAQEPEAGEQREPELGDRPDIWRELGDLPEGAIVNEQAMARIFGKCRMSVKRAVSKNQLPRPVKMFDSLVWTAGAVLKHLEGRLAAEQKDAEKLRRKVLEMAP